MAEVLAGTLGGTYIQAACVFNPKIYSDVHLTAQLSKVVERVFLAMLMAHISRWSLAGKNQFAYTKERGARDVLALLALKWVWTLDRGRKIAVYCSDVSGAVDKVSSKRFVDHQGNRVLAGAANSISSVGGSKSEPFCIRDMVYQGTDLASPPTVEPFL